MSRDPIRSGPHLSDADAAAIEAWMTRREPHAPAPVRTSPREAALERLLGLLDDAEPVSTDADRQLLVDVTFARILRARDERTIARVAPNPISGPTLSNSDAEAIDDLVAAGWSPSAAGGRTHRAHSLLALLDTTLHLGAPTERGRLVDAALARVQSEVDSESTRFRFTPVERPTFARPGIRWRDLGAIAAMFIIACSIFWPMVNGLRMESMRSAGQSNMERAALGFGMFANDHDDRLASMNNRGPDGLWWQVGTPEKSHSANLYTLVSDGYVPVAALASPANPNAPTEVADPDARDWASGNQVSYSYQLFGKVVPRLATFDGEPRVVLADRSPIIERAKLGLPVHPNANSANQAGLGQLVLFADGRVRFLRTPMLDNGDNIWLPRRLEQAAQPTVVGTEMPASRSDAFVGP